MSEKNGRCLWDFSDGVFSADCGGGPHGKPVGTSRGRSLICLNCDREVLMIRAEGDEDEEAEGFPMGEPSEWLPERQPWRMVEWKPKERR